MRRAIGALMLLALFIGLFITLAITYGWKDALGIFGIAIVMTAFVVIACWLLTGGE